MGSDLVAFTGHRNRRAQVEWFADLERRFPGASWLHGGADGFDTQAGSYTLEVLRRRPEVIRPRYKDVPPGVTSEVWVKVAPLFRNEEIVQRLILARMMGRRAVLIALWDGRVTGGTYHTQQYAEIWLVPIWVWTPDNGPGPFPAIL